MSEEEKLSYYARNRAKCLAQAKAYLEANKDYYKEYHKQYYQLNKTKRNEQRKLWDFNRKLKLKEQRQKEREKKKIVFYEKKEEPIEVPPLLSCEQELPSGCMFRSPGVTLTFE